MRADSQIFKKPDQSKQSPRWENSPNLVTLDYSATDGLL
jgi:hypothetical protein